MGSFKHARAFTPLDLEIIDKVYESAWAQVVAIDPFRDASKDAQSKDALRKLVFALAGTSPVEFDTLCDKVLVSLPQYGNAFRRGKKPRTSSPGVSI